VSKIEKEFELLEKIGRFMEKISIVFPIIAVIVSGITVAQLFLGSIGDSNITIGSRVDALNAEMRIQKFSDDLQALRGDLDGIKKLVGNVSDGNPNTAAALDIAVVRDRLSAVEGRVQALDLAIGSSPEKSLAIPILRKDFDYLVKDSDNQRAIFRAEIDKIYEQQKWMMNGLITVLLLIIGSGTALLARIYLKSPNSAS